MADKIPSKRQMHPNSLKNMELNRIKKGEVRNPNGRPHKEDCLVECIKDEFQKPSVKNSTLSKARLMAMSLTDMCAVGNLKAMEIALSWVAPKPTATTKIIGDPDNPIQWQVIVRDDKTKDLITQVKDRTIADNAG